MGCEEWCVGSVRESGVWSGVWSDVVGCGVEEWCVGC